MSKHDFTSLTWREVRWQRPFKQEQVWNALTHLAATSGRGPVVFEARGCDGLVRYLLGTDKANLSKVENVFHAHADVRFEPIYLKSRKDATGAAQIRTNRKLLSLNVDTTSLAVLRAGLAALSSTNADEELIVQIVLGCSFSPTPVSPGMKDPHASWLEILSGTVQKANWDTLKSVREKAEQSGFQCVIRIGSSNRKNYLSPLNDLLAAFRILDTAGVKLYMTHENPAKLTGADIPWKFPLKLSVKEIAGFMLLPVGEEELPGGSKLHPRSALPPKWYREPLDKSEDRSFARAMNNQKLSIEPKAALEHSILLGPTGSGKSTAMLNLILADINAGRGVLVIDPKQDLVDDVLERIPKHRHSDVAVLDPASPSPVGFNPLACGKNADKELVADTVLSVLKEIFAESWGVRTQDHLSAAILSLMESDGASLMWLPELLTNESFRSKITSKITDEIALKPFWTRFEAMSPYERKQHVEPVLNKMRQFLLRPKLRNVLGQSHPKFDLNALFTRNKIVLVPLNKGIIGGECARLLGSLIVGITWALALGRASLPQEKRKLVSIYIDELQDYLSLPTDLADALAQARGMGLAITMAHQYRDQLPPLLRSGIDANARNKIIFGLSGKDAKEIAALDGGLDVMDYVSLPRYHVYAKLQNYGRDTGWIQGVTLPKPEPLQSAVELRAESMKRYGVPAEVVEAELAAVFQNPAAEVEDKPEDFKPSKVGGKTPKRTKSDSDVKAEDFKKSTINRKRKERKDE